MRWPNTAPRDRREILPIALALLLAACADSRAPAGPEKADMASVSPDKACPEPLAAIVVPCDEPAGTPGTTVTSEGDERLTLVPTPFADLPGWADDRHGEALAAFVRSCEKLAELGDGERVGSSRYAGTARDWRAACKGADKVETSDHSAARAYFEAYFKAYAAHGQNGPDGKITGYYVHNLRAARKPDDRYRFPLFARPPDLTSVQLSDFIADGRSRRIWGYRDAQSGTLLPYSDRATIRTRAGVGPEPEFRPEPGTVLLWVDDPADAVAVEIEGSGKALLPTGETLWVAFAGKNGIRGRRSGAIMRALRELRDRRSQASEDRPMWTDADMAQFYTITDPRAAMVFFAIEERAGAIGTQDVVLSAGRSLAVDRAVIGLSTPVWVSTRAPTTAEGRTGPWHRLLIAQDTGGSILGSVRADIYWGDSPEARAIGRRVNGAGRMWLLLPRGLEVGATR